MYEGIDPVLVVLVVLSDCAQGTLPEIWLGLLVAFCQYSSTDLLTTDISCADEGADAVQVCQNGMSQVHLFCASSCV